eukprot:jgi/Ulvmu1/2385/UM130_0018.1
MLSTLARRCRDGAAGNHSAMVGKEGLEHVASLGVEVGASPTGYVARAGYGAIGSGVNTGSKPTIQQMVTNLRESMKEVHDRVGEAAALDPVHDVLEQKPRHDEPQQDPVPTVVPSARLLSRGINDKKSYPGLGHALRNAVFQAQVANRFDVVRDSVTGEPTEALMVPTDRPFAEARNILTEAEMINLVCETDPVKALEAAVADGEADEIPSGFQRLRSPRCSHHETAPIQKTLQAQLDCLPMTYAAQFEGHLRDLRVLLGTEVWHRVQEAVDWNDWTDDEKLAALSRVLFPRGKEMVLNADELLEASANKPQQLQLRSRAPALQPQVSKRRRSTAGDCEVLADYAGISVKRNTEAGPTQALTEEQAVRLLKGLRRAANMPGADADGYNGAQRAQQLLRSVPAAAHPIPTEDQQPARVYGPPETFWEDLEAQVAEGLRQAQRAPRLVDLVASTERALFLVSQQRHYANLAARLFAQQVAVTRVQAAWRGYQVRKWYQQYQKTEEFSVRQQEYEAQMRERWEEEEREAAVVAEAVQARKLSAERREAQRQDQNLQQWKQRSRYMNAAAAVAAKSVGQSAVKAPLPTGQRKEQGRQYLEAGKARGKRASSPSKPADAPSSTAGSDDTTRPNASVDGSMPRTPLSREVLEQHVPEAPSLSQSPPPSRRRRGPASIGGSSFSSFGNVSRATGRRNRPDDTRSGWLSTHSTASEEPEQRVLDESMATTRLRERRAARQARREAARRLGNMRPEQQAAARSEEERIGRRMAVMEQVLGADNAGRFDASMHAALASSGYVDAGHSRRSSNDGGGPSTDNRAIASLTALPTIRESPSVSMAGDSIRMPGSHTSYSSSIAGGVMQRTATPPLGGVRGSRAASTDDGGLLGPVAETSVGRIHSEASDGEFRTDLTVNRSVDDGAAKPGLAPSPPTPPVATDADTAPRDHSFGASDQGRKDNLHARMRSGLGATGAGRGATGAGDVMVRARAACGDVSMHGSSEDEEEEAPEDPHALSEHRDVVQQVQRVSLEEPSALSTHAVRAHGRDHVQLPDKAQHGSVTGSEQMDAAGMGGSSPAGAGSCADVADSVADGAGFPGFPGWEVHAPPDCAAEAAHGQSTVDAHVAGVHHMHQARRLQGRCEAASLVPERSLAAHSVVGSRVGSAGDPDAIELPPTAVPTSVHSMLPPRTGSTKHAQHSGVGAPAGAATGRGFMDQLPDTAPGSSGDGVLPRCTSAAPSHPPVLSAGPVSRGASGACGARQSVHSSRGSSRAQSAGDEAGMELGPAGRTGVPREPSAHDLPTCPLPPAEDSVAATDPGSTTGAAQLSTVVVLSHRGEPAAALQHGRSSSTLSGRYAADAEAARLPAPQRTPHKTSSLARHGVGMDMAHGAEEGSVYVPAADVPLHLAATLSGDTPHAPHMCSPAMHAADSFDASRSNLHSRGSSASMGMRLGSADARPPSRAAPRFSQQQQQQQQQRRDGSAVHIDAGAEDEGDADGVWAPGDVEPGAAAAVLMHAEQCLRADGHPQQAAAPARMGSMSFMRMASMGLADSSAQGQPTSSAKPYTQPSFLPQIHSRSSTSLMGTQSPLSARSSQHEMDAVMHEDPPRPGSGTQDLMHGPNGATSTAPDGDTGKMDTASLNSGSSGTLGSSSGLSGASGEGGYGGMDLVAALLGRLDRELSNAQHAPAQQPRSTRCTVDSGAAALPALPSMASGASAMARMRDPETERVASAGVAVAAGWLPQQLLVAPSLPQLRPSMSQLNEVISQLRRGRTDGAGDVIKRVGSCGDRRAAPRR